MITNKYQFDTLVEEMCSEYGFPFTDDTREAIATVILHAPPDMGEFSYEYIKNRVSKMMANKTAYDFLQELKASRQAKQAETPKQEVPQDAQPDTQKQS